MPEATVLQLPFKQDAGPHAPIQMGAWTQTISSFGLDHTTTGPDFDANGLVNSPRVKELEFRSQYYTCRQHDWKTFDFNGRIVGAGRKNAVQPLIGGSMPSFFVSLDQRRPSAPYRIGRKIVASFTALLFGHGRFPNPRSADTDTQDFADALVEESALEVKMQRARNIGGSCGTVGLSWCFYEGKPRVEVHHGKNVHVLEWEDEQERVPAHVVVLVKVERQVRGANGKRETKLYWKRQDWTRDADIVFRECEVTRQNPIWVIDEEQSYRHDHGECHFVYVENLPDDDDSSVDGEPDYAENYESMNQLDIINSVVLRGAALNLDPTLVLRMNAEDLAMSERVKKGSENALITGIGGDAKYLELGGTSISVGKDLVLAVRQQVLETSEAIVPNPDQVAAAGLSSVALKMIYAPALSKTDVMRHQYGTAIERLLNGMADAARRVMPEPGTEDPYVYEVEVDAEGNQVNELPVEYHLDLEPRIEEVEVVDEETGESRVETKQVERHPGAGRITLEWGPYFKPTADDVQKEGGAMVAATGGRPALSQRTAVERVANMLDRDGTEEWQRVEQEREQEANAMYPMPPGEGGDEATGEELAGSLEPTGKIELAPTDIAKIVKVNEARADIGKPALMLADGTLDPNGFLTISAFDAKMKAEAEANAAVGQKQAEAQIEQQSEAVKAQAEAVEAARQPSPEGGQL